MTSIFFVQIFFYLHPNAKNAKNLVMKDLLLGGGNPVLVVVHLGLLTRLPGLRRLTLHTPLTSPLHDSKIGIFIF